MRLRCIHFPFVFSHTCCVYAWPVSLDRNEKKNTTLFMIKKINETYFMQNLRISWPVKQYRKQRVKYYEKVMKVIFVVLQLNDTIIHS